MNFISEIFDMVDTRSNMQLADLKSKSLGGKIIMNLIDCAIGARFYPPTGLEHHKLIQLYQFHVTTLVNNIHETNNDENRIMHPTRTAKNPMHAKLLRNPV